MFLKLLLIKKKSNFLQALCYNMSLATKIFLLVSFEWDLSVQYLPKFKEEKLYYFAMNTGVVLLIKKDMKLQKLV